MPDLSEDRALLDSFRAGERAALERVYEEYVGWVASMLRRGFAVKGASGPTSVTLRGTFEIENAVQEVFFRAFRERARLSYDGLRPYRDYLSGIARHVVIDELRKKGRQPIMARDDQLVELADETNVSPEEAAAKSRAVDVVRQFLEEECDDKDRQLYRLRYVDELSQNEAASSAELTRIQVRRWESKFRARLLRHLKRVDYV